MTKRPWLSALAIAAVYFVVAAISVRYTRFHGGVALIWGATALLLACLVTRPRSQWPLPIVACGLAGAAATMLFGLGPHAALPFALINVSEAIGGALILQRLGTSCRFTSLREIAVFLGVAGLAMPAACGLFAAVTTHWITGLPLARNWFDYFAGHGLGAITFTPLVMLATSGDVRSWASEANRRERAEALVLVLLMAGVTVFAFGQNTLPLLFLPLLPMMIAVFRIGRIGAAVTILLLTAIALAFTLDGDGPISLIKGNSGMRAQFLQAYLACAVLIVLPAAAELKHRKLSFAELQANSAVARLVLDRTGDIIMMLSVDGTIRYVSPSIDDIAGYQPEDLLGGTPHALIHPDDIEEVVRVHRQALQTPDDTFIIEYRARRADGEFAWYEVHTRATVDEGGTATGVVSIIREISARKSAESQLVRDALTDPLTELLNRRGFDGEMARRMPPGGAVVPFAIVTFDLDHFKAINDTYGHETGDRVIKAFAIHLRKALRKDDVIARFGGEEFVAALTGANGDAAREVCERLRASFAQRIHQAVDGRLFRVTVSGGIATFRKGADLAQVLAEADAALYRAKSEGRNRLALAA